MSYILDAIKKADEKRKPEAVPDVHAEHEAPPDKPPPDEPRRPGWLYGLAAILIVNAGGIGWWLWSGTPAKVQVAEHSEKPAAVQPVPQAQPSSPQRAKSGRPPVAPSPSTPAATVKTVAGGVPSPPAPQKVVRPGAPPLVVKTEVAFDDSSESSNATSAVPPATWPQGGRPPRPGAGPASRGEVLSGTVAPQTSPAAPPRIVSTGEQGGAASLQAERATTVPSAAKREEPQTTRDGVRPPSPPPAAEPPMPEGKAVKPPAVAGPGGEKTPDSPPLPSASAAQGPAVAADERGKAAPPQAVVPADEAPDAVAVPELTPGDEDIAAVPDEALIEADEEVPAVDEAEGEETTEAPADDQALTPIAKSAEGRGKPGETDKESEEDPELAKLPFLRQLPAEIQQGMPELHISFHAYSIKPSARLVSMGGKILREGQAAGENLTLERITVKGVVLSYKGRRFRLEM